MNSAAMHLTDDWAAMLAIFALPAVFVAAWTWTATIGLQQHYAALEALSKHFQGRVSRLQRYLLNQPCFVGTFRGCDFSVTCLYGKRRGLTMACHFRSSGRLRILMYDRNMLHVFSAERVEIGDQYLAKYFIYSNMPDEARRYFSDASRREAIKELGASGWRLTEIRSGSISALAEGGPAKPSIDPKMVEATLRNLVALRVEAASA